jgi:hypothetical protein
MDYICWRDVGEGGTRNEEADGELAPLIITLQTATIDRPENCFLILA